MGSILIYKSKPDKSGYVESFYEVQYKNMDYSEVKYFFSPEDELEGRVEEVENTPAPVVEEVVVEKSEVEELKEIILEKEKQIDTLTKQVSTAKEVAKHGA